MSKPRKRYYCKCCRNDFYLILKPQIPTTKLYCPICGSDDVCHGTAKSYETIREHIENLQLVIPKMSELFDQMSELYTEYMTSHELLKTYHKRGLVDKDVLDSVTYILPSLTERFYESRKKKE